MDIDLSIILKFIQPELLVLLPVLYLIGFALKKSKLNDKFIPLILGGISIVLCTIWVCVTSPLAGAGDIAIAVFTGISQGVLIAGGSVYVNQIFKQLTKKEG